ncbi:ABC transporter permease [Actinocatenispora comari]|uniref:Transporter n=1 Tax=Actinocatenispora comari TaxID=2807577 RepID=A0A8J4AE09_9ACTN|nr:ABC transporter permease subunit [Actinocatenispora comari]GIL27407.1 transporter [Actinocatenispora comari]
MSAVRAGAPAATASVPWRRLSWVVWRQHRAVLLTLVIALAAAAGALVLTGLGMRVTWHAMGLDHCRALIGSAIHGGRCGIQLSLFASRPPASLAGFVVDGLHLVPPLIGMFVGAPLLAREFETGTIRFAWTQGVGRHRLVAGKMVFLAAVVGAGTVALGALFSWWYHLFDFTDARGGRWAAQTFDLGAGSLAGWSLFGFALGLLCGVALRRTVPAMAVTAIAYATPAILVPWLVRPRLLALFPVTSAMSVPESGPQHGNLVLHSWIVDGHGRRLDEDTDPTFPRLVNMTPHQIEGWLTAHHASIWQTYQPASRLWMFQTIEGAGLTLLAVTLGLLTLRRLTRLSV